MAIKIIQKKLNFFVQRPHACSCVHYPYVHKKDFPKNKIFFKVTDKNIFCHFFGWFSNFFLLIGNLYSAIFSFNLQIPLSFSIPSSLSLFFMCLICSSVIFLRFRYFQENDKLQLFHFASFVGLEESVLWNGNGIRKLLNEFRTVQAYCNAWQLCSFVYNKQLCKQVNSYIATWVSALKYRNSMCED